MVKKIWDNRALRIFRKGCFSDTCNTRICSTRVMLLELLGYGTLLSRNVLVGCNSTGQTGKEVVLARRRLLRNVTGNHELNMLWWRKCLDNNSLQINSNDATER